MPRCRWLVLRSGEVVGKLSRYYKVPPSRLLVISDDLDLPLGTLRLRTKGGAGGHNGLRSIMQHLGGTQVRESAEWKAWGETPGKGASNALGTEQTWEAGYAEPGVVQVAGNTVRMSGVGPPGNERPGGAGAGHDGEWRVFRAALLWPVHWHLRDVLRGGISGQAAQVAGKDAGCARVQCLPPAVQRACPHRLAALPASHDARRHRTIPTGATPSNVVIVGMYACILQMVAAMCMGASPLFLQSYPARVPAWSFLSPHAGMPMWSGEVMGGRRALPR